MNAGYRLPAEWEPQAAVLLAWPYAGTDWAPRLAQIETTYAGLVAAIARFEDVLICVANADIRAHAVACLGASGIDFTRVRFVEVAYDDTWLRDSGPVTLVEANAYQLVDFHFTGWGGKFEGGRDDRLVEALIGRGVFHAATHRRIDWALEGGAIESDGAGTILTTWRCLHLRHPAMSRVDIERKLGDAFHAQRILWLDHGYLEGDDTDAHIDTLARFAPDDAIVFQACDDPADAHYAELARMREEITGLRTTAGQPYRLFPLPWPRAIFDGERRLASSYANYLVVNGGVVMPAYDDAADDIAARVIAQAHPGREVVKVDARALIWQNGSVHCLTMQLPAGILSSEDSA